MKHVLLFALSTVFYFSSTAQCTTYIYPSPGHIQVTTNSSINATGTVYWICSGLTVNILSSPGSIYMCEANVTLNIQGSDGDQIFAKPGCIINNSSDADLGVTCYPPSVTLNNTGIGSITIDANCNPVIYDYSMIGGSGTCASTGIDEPTLKNVDMYPNPVTSYLIVSGLENKGEAKLFNAVGEMVNEWKVDKSQTKIDLADLPAGVYFLQVRTADGVATKKIVKQ